MKVRDLAEMLYKGHDTYPDYTRDPSKDTIAIYGKAKLMEGFELDIYVGKFVFDKDKKPILKEKGDCEFSESDIERISGLMVVGIGVLSSGGICVYVDQSPKVNMR